MLEAEKRGLLPPEKLEMLNEARSRGLVEKPMSQYSGGKFYTQPVEATPDDLEYYKSLPRTQPSKGPRADIPSENLQRLSMLQKGMTFGFGEEMAGMMGADKDYLRRGMEVAREERPGESMALEIAGGIMTGLGPGKKAMELTARGLPKTVATMTPKQKLMAVGGATGGLYGAGEAVEGERIEGAVKGGLFGLGTGFALGTINGRVAKMFGKKEIPFTSDDVKQLSSQAYKRAEEQGGVLLPRVTNRFLDSARKRVMPRTEAGRLVGGKGKVAEVMENLEQLRGKNLTLREAQEIDEFLSDMIDGATDMGKLTKEGKKLFDVQNAFRATIDNAPAIDVAGGKAGFSSLKEGRRLWSQSAKLRDIERIITRAEMTDNPATSLKSGFRTLYNNPKRMRGYNTAERAAIKKAAESGVVTDLLKTAGSRLVPIITASVGGGLGPSAVAAAGSMASRGAATKVQLAKARKIADVILRNKGEPTPSVRKALAEDVGLSELVKRILGESNK